MYCLQECRDANAALHADAVSLKHQLDTSHKLLAAPDRPKLDDAMHSALQVCSSTKPPAAGIIL
jgi:hypothetical protein